MVTNEKGCWKSEKKHDCKAVAKLPVLTKTRETL